MSFMYILPLKNKTAFKIGKSDKPMSRITRLLNFYDIDIEEITIINCLTTATAYSYESALHAIFKKHNLVLNQEGGTEFFDYSAYRDVVEMCDIICRMNGYSKVAFKKDQNIKPLSKSQISVLRFANIARNKRLELNLSQADLAHASQVSKRTIERFEKTGIATFENVIQIFAALGIEDIFDTKLSNPMKQRIRSKSMKCHNTPDQTT